MSKYERKYIFFAPFGAATDTGLAAEIYDTVGDYAGGTLDDGADQNVNIDGIIPSDFADLIDAKIVMIPLGTGDALLEFSSEYAQAGEAYNNNTDSIAAATYAVTANQITEIDVFDLFDALDYNDYLAVKTNRDATDILDTVNAAIKVIGLKLVYNARLTPAP